jgi:hypothetical protein
MVAAVRRIGNPYDNAKAESFMADAKGAAFQGNGVASVFAPPR